VSSFSNPDQERVNQIREASRMGEPEGGERPTLSVPRPRPKTVVNNARNSDRNNDRDNARRPSAPRAKHTPKGHDAKLKAWQAESREVVVGLIFGVSETVDTHTGRIVDSDRYTITLRFSTGADALIYKHAIACIYPQPECCAPAGMTQ